MTEAYGFDLETYLARTGRLRRLAQSLTLDAAAADDAVQETWQQALRTSGADDDARWSSNWLEVVLRNTVRRQRRSAGRRRRREVVAARDEAVPGADDIAVRSELVRELSAAIDELAPPLRECTVLRYFEDLPPRTIAQRLGVPRRDVYRRLEAAREALRERLTARGYSPRIRRLGWTAWLAWPGGLAADRSVRLGHWLTTVGAGLVMAKVVWSVVVLAMAGMLWWFVASDRDEPMTGGSDRARVEAPTVVQTAGASVAEREQVGEVQPEPTAPAATGPRFPFALDVHVVDADDRPADYAQIWAAPVGHPLNRHFAGADGVVRLRFDGRLASMDFVVGGPARSGVLLRRLSLHSGATSTLGLQLARNKAATRDEVEASLRAVELPPPRSRRDREGRTTFVVAARGLAFVQGATEFDEMWASEMAMDDVTGRGKIHGVVRDAKGRPAAGVFVVARDVPGVDEEAHEVGTHAASRTDASGRYELTVSPGPYRILAGGGDFGRAERQVDVDAEGLEWNPQLDRGAEFRGTLRLASGAPASKWWVRIESTDRSVAFHDRVQVGEEGTFALPNVPVAQCRVLAQPRFTALPIELAVAAPVGPVRSFVVAPSTKQVTALGRLAGAERVAVEARLWDSATGFGVRQTSSSGDVRFADVPPGLHRLQLAGPALNFEPALPLSISDRSPAVTELGDVQVHPAAILTFWLPGESRPVRAAAGESASEAVEEPEEPSAAAELIWRHPLVDSAARLRDAEGVRMVAVPPGTWAVRVGEFAGEFEAPVPGLEYAAELGPSPQKPGLQK